MERLRTLFYGMTHEHASAKLETLKRMSDTFEVVAIADDRPRGTPCHSTDEFLPADIPVVPEETARRMDVDCVLVETANADLMEIASHFAGRGVPMHCDKPCGEAMEPYRAIVERCRAKNLPMQIGYMYRGNPAVRLLDRIAAERWLGAVSFIEADMNHNYGLAGYPAYISTFRGGILYNLGGHLIDMAIPFLAGNPTKVRTVLGDAQGDPAGSRTRCAAWLEWPGAEVLIRASSQAPGGLPCRRLRIDGTNGTLDLCPIERFDGVPLAMTVTLKEPAGGLRSGENRLEFGVQTDRYRDQLVEFAAAVRDPAANPSSYDRDLRVHELTLRMCGLL